MARRLGGGEAGRTGGWFFPEGLGTGRRKLAHGRRNHRGNDGFFARARWKRCVQLCLIDSEALRHLFVQKAFPSSVGLNPFTINHELRDGTFARLLDNCFGRARRALDVDFFVGNVMSLQKPLGLAAIAAPEC